jgi:hypothetical protein
LAAWNFDRTSSGTEGINGENSYGCDLISSTGEFAEEVGFVHAVLEGLAAVDENYRDFVGELAAELFVAINVDVLPGKTAATMQLGEGLFDDFAEMTSFARVDHDLPGLRHCGEFSKGGAGFPVG